MADATLDMDPGSVGVDDPSSATSSAATTSGFDVRILTDFTEAETDWRALESDCVMSVYHSFDWLQRWYEHVGKRDGIEPVLAIGTRADQTAFILPLGVKKSGPLRVATWLGGKLNNYNFGLWRSDVYASMSADELSRCLGDIARHVRIDAFELLNIPETWDGRETPFVKLPHSASPSHSYILDLDGDFEALQNKHRSSKSRRTQRKKLERLQAAGDYKTCHAVNAGPARAVIDATIEQRNQRAAASGIPSVFEQPGVSELMRHIVVESAGDAEPVMDTHFLAVDGVIRATYVGGVKNGRYSCSLNSFRDDDLTQHSPGDLLLTEVIRNCCERGLKQLDLGIGEMRYKTAWCRPDPLIDCFIPVTLIGRTHARLNAGKQALKRAIKGNAMLWGLVLRLRKMRSRLG